MREKESGVSIWKSLKKMEEEFVLENKKTSRPANAHFNIDDLIELYWVNVNIL
jgi:hypothetical protein